MMLPQYFFYCAHCELKTKAALFFSTWCPCKESNVIATIKQIKYSGMAVSQEAWEAMEKDNETLIGPVSSNFMRNAR